MYSTVQCISKSSRKVAALAQGAYTLAVLGSMQPKQKMPKITGTVLNHIEHHCYVDTIFVLSDLGTDQGMSTKLGDQKLSRNFA